MSVIQKIRDKYARVSVIAIGVALLGFILMDAVAGRGSFFGGESDDIGEINGKNVDTRAFTRKVTEIQQQNAQATTEQIVTQLWNEEVEESVMGEQYEELGLTVTAREMDLLLYSTNASPIVRQAFGEGWEPNTVRQKLGEFRRGTTTERTQVTVLEEAVRKQALKTKYIALLTNSVNVPKWYLEKRNVDNSQMAKAAYVAVPYTVIADSTVKVTDEEITNYMQAHKKDYELEEESRSISYVPFSAVPSSADSNRLREELINAKAALQADTNMSAYQFTNRNVKYFDEFFSTADYQWLASMANYGQQGIEMLRAKGLPVITYPLQNIDSIAKVPTGIVGGPFVEQGYLITSKITERTTQPDTVKVRHILVALEPKDATGKALPARDSVTAKRIIDSVQQVIASGASFDTVAARISDDAGSKFKGGVYDSVTRQTGFVKEFVDFAFNNPVGSRRVVKTVFGYHYIEVLSQRGFSPVFKLALMELPIDASAETITTAEETANQFAGNAKDEKSFNEYFDKNLKGKGFNKLSAPGLKPMAFNFGTTQGNPSEMRELIKAVFEADKGDVLNPKRIGSDYIVAVVTDVSKPGLPSAASVRPMLEPVLMNKKKADKIKQQMGTVTDLNAVAAKFNQQIQPADSVSFNGRTALGYEPRVLGAIFNPANKGKVCPEGIAGQVGVYAIRVDNTFTGAVDNANVDMLRKEEEGRMRQQIGDPLELLKKRVEIKDNRVKFY